MSAKVALQLNAALGLVSAAVASSLIWLVLTRPTDVAYAIAEHEYGSIALAIGHELTGLLHVLLRYL